MKRSLLIVLSVLAVTASIVAQEGRNVALIHVNVVNPIAGQELEYLVLRRRLGSPPLSERVYDSVRFLYRAIDEVFDLIAQVVVRPRKIRRKDAHLEPVEKITSNKVECLLARCASERGEPIRKSG